MFVVHTDSTTDTAKVLVDLWYLVVAENSGAGVFSTAVLRLHMKHDICNYGAGTSAYFIASRTTQ